MQDLHVRRYMTASPYTIDRDQAISDADALMKRHNIRHLPVVEGRTLVGIVSELETAFLTALCTRMPDRLPIGEFMTPNPYVGRREHANGRRLPDS